MIEQSLESLFSENNFFVYGTGPVLQGSTQNTTKSQIVYYDENKTKIAEVRSTDPESRQIRDHYALYGSDDVLIMSVDIKSTYGIHPEINAFVKDKNGAEIGSMVIDSSASQRFMVKGVTVLSLAALSQLNYRKGGEFKDEHGVVATIEMNKTGLIRFDGYKLSLNSDCKRSYLIPLATHYIKNFAPISKLPKT